MMKLSSYLIKRYGHGDANNISSNGTKILDNLGESIQKYTSQIITPLTIDIKNGIPHVSSEYDNCWDEITSNFEDIENKAKLLDETELIHYYAKTWADNIGELLIIKATLGTSLNMLTLNLYDGIFNSWGIIRDNLLKNINNKPINFSFSPAPDIFRATLCKYSDEWMNIYGFSSF